VQEANDTYAVGQTPEEHDMSASLMPRETGANVVAGSAKMRRMGEKHASILEQVEVSGTLQLAPFAPRVGANIVQVSFSERGEGVSTHDQRAGNPSLARTRLNAPSGASPLASPASMASRSLASLRL